MSEPRVPKPNQSPCGFHALRSLGCKLMRGDKPPSGYGTFECDEPEEWRATCCFAKFGRALHVRQQKERDDAHSE